MGQKASSEVAGSSQPLYPSLPPEEQLPEAEVVPEVGRLSAEQGEREGKRLGWFKRVICNISAIIMVWQITLYYDFFFQNFQWLNITLLKP